MDHACTWHRPTGGCDRAPFAAITAGAFTGDVCAKHLQRVCALAEAGKTSISSAARLG